MKLKIDSKTQLKYSLQHHANGILDALLNATGDADYYQADKADSTAKDYKRLLNLRTTLLRTANERSVKIKTKISCNNELLIWRMDE